MERLYRYGAGTIVFLFMAFVGCAVSSSGSKLSGDDYVRANVVKLVSDFGSCTGVRIKAPSGRFYVLTAAHCAPLATLHLDPMNPLGGGYFSIEAQSDDGRKSESLAVIAVDPYSDLMLLETHTFTGLIIAKSTFPHQRVHTMGHGGGLPIFRTDGEMIKEEYHPEDAPLGWIKSLSSTVIIPGNSGGPLLNEDNELVGITTNIDQWRIFAYSTPLSQIKAFLQGR